MMDRFAVINALEEIANYLEISDDKPFRAMAYRKAARSLQTAPLEPAELVRRGELLKTPGIGKATAAIIEEIVAQGRSAYLEELRADYPSGIFELLRVPNLGLRKIKQLYDSLGVANLDDLRSACAEKKLRKLPGFGAKTEEKICASLDKINESPDRVLLPVGIETAELLAGVLRGVSGVEAVEISGSVRRRLETVGDVDLVVVAGDPEKVLARVEKRNLLGDPERGEGLLHGVTGSGLRVDLYFTTPAELPIVLAQSTGSSEFVEALAKRVAAEPTKKKLKDEEALFAHAGVGWIPPELRESAAVLARRKKSWPLIERTEIRGTFHIHSTWSDGRASIADMLRGARDMGLTYAGLSDHSKSAFYAGGLTELQLTEQHAEIDRAAGSFPELRVFRGSEVDILLDGALDYDAATLAKLDFVIASVHSRFKMDRDQMTQRIVTALENPFTTFLGHLTGRLLLSREGYSVDFDRVFETAGKNGVMIEINGNPHRLDLDWRLMKKALDYGVMFAVNPDAHSVAEMRHIQAGIWNARKGGLEAKHVFNTREAGEVAEYLAARRLRAIQKQKAESRKLK